MDFTEDFIPNPSSRRYLYQNHDEEVIHSVAGTEIESLGQFLDEANPESVWVSLASYSDPHISSNQSIIGSLFAVRITEGVHKDSLIETAERYKKYFETDFAGELFAIRKSEEILLVELTGKYRSLSDHQRVQFGTFTDLQETTLDQLTQAGLSYNQNTDSNTTRSTYGVGMSHRVFEYIYTDINNLINTDDPVSTVESKLTGRNTQDRAESIVDALESGSPEEILFSLGTLQPKSQFKQLVNKSFRNAKTELSIPVQPEDVFQSTEYIPLPGSKDIEGTDI
jgi:hypothetical protein